MLSPSPLACRQPPHPRGRRLAAGVAIALGAGGALADPRNEAHTAAEAEASQQPLVMEWGSPLGTHAAAPAAVVEQLEPARRLGDWAMPQQQRQTGGSLLLSRSRLQAESAPNEGAGDTANAFDAPQRARVDMDNIAYRWWFARERSSVSLGLGAATYRVRGVDAGPLREFGDTTLGAPLISVGLRHRMTESALLYLDAASTRRLGADEIGSDYYGARAGVEWQASRNATFAIEQGKVRVRLYSTQNSQMSLRVKKGGPMLVYRRTF